MAVMASDLVIQQAVRNGMHSHPCYNKFFLDLKCMFLPHTAHLNDNRKEDTLSANPAP